jgi:hypothetical protein
MKLTVYATGVGKNYKEVYLKEDVDAEIQRLEAELYLARNSVANLEDNLHDATMPYSEPPFDASAPRTT